MNKGLIIVIADKTKSGVKLLRYQKIHVLSAQDAYIFIHNNYKQVSTFVIKIRTSNLDVFQAFDIAKLMQKCSQSGCIFHGFIFKFTLANLIAVSFAKTRICPPLEGPLKIEFILKKIEISSLNNFLTLIGSNVKEGTMFSINTDSNVSQPRINEVENTIKSAIIDILRQGTGLPIINESYDSAAEAAVEGLLTHTMYVNDFNKLNIFNGIKLKSCVTPTQTIRKNNFIFKIRAQLNNIIGIYHFNCSAINSSFESKKLFKLLRRLENVSIKSLIIVIKHKGGDAKIADELFCYIKDFKHNFPIFFYVHIATSAGLLLASSGNLMAIQQISIVGSFGSITPMINWAIVGNRLGFNISYNQNLEGITHNNDLTYALLSKRLADSSVFNKVTLNKILLGQLLTAYSIETGVNATKVDSLHALIEQINTNHLIDCNTFKLISLNLTGISNNIISQLLQRLNRVFG